MDQSIKQHPVPKGMGQTAEYDHWLSRSFNILCSTRLPKNE